MPVASTLPRTVLPRTVTAPTLPTGLVSIGRTGKAQRRGGLAAGWQWTETWGVLIASDADVEALVAFLDHYWNSLDTFAASHLLLPGMAKANNGAATSCLVDGASQTGTTLHVDGLTPSQASAIAAGDWLVVGAAGQAYKVVTTADADGGGDADLEIVPSIPVGSSPADNTAVTLQSGTMQVYMADYRRPTATPDEFYAGIQVTFAEAI